VIRPTEPLGAPEVPEPARGHWWEQRLPSVLLLVFTTVAVLAMVRTATEVLPEVGKDRLGADNWNDPIGVELANGFQVGRVPECAAGAFTRIVLWNPDSEPYWEVVGPPTPLNTFLVGVAPEGFTTVTPFSDPPRGAVLRLVAFRRDGGAVGIRYQAEDLREKRVMSGNPLVPFTVDGFQEADVCDDPSSSGGTDDTVDEPDTGPTSTTPGLGWRGPSTSTTIDDGTGVYEDPGIDEVPLPDDELDADLDADLDPDADLDADADADADG
jgi:hypothetical protein